jgi:hypothetical protein
VLRAQAGSQRSESEHFVLSYKRFHEAVFELPVPVEADSGVSVRIDGQKLAALLAGKPKTRKTKAKLRVVR